MLKEKRPSSLLLYRLPEASGAEPTEQSESHNGFGQVSPGAGAQEVGFREYDMQVLNIDTVAQVAQTAITQ